MSKAAALKADVRELARAVASDLRRGQLDPQIQDIGSALAGDPEAVFALLDLAAAEHGRKRPNESLIAAILLLIGEVLRASRMSIEDGVPEPAKTLLAEIRSRVAAAVRAGRIGPPLLMALSRAFIAAKLDPGDDLRAAAAALLDDGSVEDGSEPPETLFAGEDLAAALGDDPFAIQARLDEEFAIFPRERREVAVDALVDSDAAILRDAAIGWLLDADPGLAARVARSLAAAAGRGLVSPASVDRMVLLRPWVAAEVQEGIDRAVRACRQRGGAPAARPAGQVATVIVSGCDGAGAQTLVALAKHGRTLTAATLLFKHEVGIRDAWVAVDLTRRDADALLSSIEESIDPFDASPEIAKALIAHGLAVGLETGTAPPFGLVQVVEAVGLGQIEPRRYETGALVGDLLAGIPEERRSPAAVDAALAASRDWPERYAFPESWFEVDSRLLEAAKARGAKQRETRLLDDVLPTRRAHWAGRLAWTAFAARDAVDADDWIEFAIVANEFLGERDLRAIPLAGWIARQTARAMQAS